MRRRAPWVVARLRTLAHAPNLPGCHEKCGTGLIGETGPAFVCLQAMPYGEASRSANVRAVTGRPRAVRRSLTVGHRPGYAVQPAIIRASPYSAAAMRQRPTAGSAVRHSP
ncbi:hypothetical protein [Sinosporangium siamense]|uniref:Uncharacterized protein n=1 Tax=Sinosporangium siamense TaxID=1367973 RepID=A0A919V2I3_9ACTN|nr:hypothetical protein [Sinosporangium siamense]GII89955.1 hypothetical protein Ssi02_01860 [Sinosporangium siamense]